MFKIAFLVFTIRILTSFNDFFYFFKDLILE